MVGSCSCAEERDVARLCWGLGPTVGGPEARRPRPCGLCWGTFGFPGCSGAPARDGGRLGCGVGAPAEGSETLRVVQGLCGLCGIVGDVNGSAVKDKARFARRGGPSRRLSTEGPRVMLIGKVTESYRQTVVVNTRLQNPTDPKDLPMEIKCDHPYKGCRCDNLLADTLCKTVSCDWVVGVALGLRIARFVCSSTLSGGLQIPRAVVLRPRPSRGGHSGPSRVRSCAVMSDRV